MGLCNAWKPADDNGVMEVTPVTKHRPARRVLLAALALVGLAALGGCRRQAAAPASALPAGATVLALGDSLTFGTGADPAASYPAQLAALTGWRVVNAGEPGDTAAQALARLPALLDEHRPQLVVVSIGGNDFLRRQSVRDAQRAVRESIVLARQAGAQVVLVGVPQPSLGAALGSGLSDHPLYDELASELKVPLHAGGWARVLGDDKLRADPIHANAAGYRAFAEGLVQTLAKAGHLTPP
jgi:acyl-CoA thioesterase I